MKRLFCTTLFFLLSFLFLFPNPAATQELTIGNYSLVQGERVSRTEFNYTYSAQIINAGARDLQNVTATVTSTSPDTVVVDANLTFGNVPTSATVTTGNTFTVRHNRLVAFDLAVLVWDIQFAPAVTITSPASLSFFATSPILVTGEVSEDATEVRVNKVSASLTGQTWTATVPLKEGNNMITAVAKNEAGKAEQ